MGLQGALRSEDRGLVFECVRQPAEGSAHPGTGPRPGRFHAGDDRTGLSRHPLRILDYIHGRTLSQIVPRLDRTTRISFTIIPILLDEYVRIVEAIRFLHQSGEKHGDIRRDHLIKDETTGKYRWIDYDFNYRHGESRFAYDLFGLGNILVFITGRAM